jgi:hypothetical protein
VTKRDRRGESAICMHRAAASSPPCACAWPVPSRQMAPSTIKCTGAASVTCMRLTNQPLTKNPSHLRPYGNSGLVECASLVIGSAQPAWAVSAYPPYTLHCESVVLNPLDIPLARSLQQRQAHLQQPRCRQKRRASDERRAHAAAQPVSEVAAQPKAW